MQRLRNGIDFIKPHIPIILILLAFGHFLFDFFTVLNEALVGGIATPATNALMGVDFQIHSFILYLGILAIVFRRLKWFHPLIAYLMSLSIPEAFFTTTVHDIFVSLGLYPDFFRETATSEVNRNFAKITSLGIVGFILLLKVLKRPRTMELIYTVLIFWSIMLTSYLFHTVTKVALVEFRENEAPVLRMVSDADQKLFDDICKELEFECYEYGSGARTVYDIEDPIKQDFMRRTLEDTRNTPGTIFTAHSNDRRSVYNVLVRYRKNGDVRFLFDTNLYKSSLYRWQFLYSTLALSAHFVWLFGGGYLLYWHKKRFRKRISAYNQ